MISSSKYGLSMKSENDAYYRALEMLERSGIELNSVRADKYYLGQNVSDYFDENTSIFII